MTQWEKSVAPVFNHTHRRNGGKSIESHYLNITEGGHKEANTQTNRGDKWRSTGNAEKRSK